MPATGFFENRPNFGQLENNALRTKMYILYDNNSVYVQDIDMSELEIVWLKN